MGKSIKITKENLEFITGEDFTRIENFARFNSYCGTCQKNYGEMEMVEYEIFLDESNDVLFKGKCKSCMGNMTRYIEMDKKFWIKTQYIKDKKLKK